MNIKVIYLLHIAVRALRKIYSNFNQYNLIKNIVYDRRLLARWANEYYL